jgi:hypothetical protein
MALRRPDLTAASRRSAIPALLAFACATSAPDARAAAVEITGTQALSFGRFVAGTGTVVISPSGARTTTGAVIPLGSDPGQAAQFQVTGDPSASYAITLPADGTVQLGNGSHSMPVKAFTSSPASTSVLPGGGSEILNVGATLEVGSGMPTGTYSGSFTLVVEYN